MVRLPVHLHELMARVMRIEAEHRARHGGQAPTPEQIAAAAGVSVDKLLMLSKVLLSHSAIAMV